MCRGLYESVSDEEPIEKQSTGPGTQRLVAGRCALFNTLGRFWDPDWAFLDIKQIYTPHRYPPGRITIRPISGNERSETVLKSAEATPLTIDRWLRNPENRMESPVLETPGLRLATHPRLFRQSLSEGGWIEACYTAR